MDNPIFFLFKIIFDFLGYFFNINGDLPELVKNQQNYNIIISILQSELGPGILPISLHNSCHCSQSIVTCGDLVSSNCFASETSYQVLKKGIYPCAYPHKTGGKRYLTYIMSRTALYTFFRGSWNGFFVEGSIPKDDLVVELKGGSSISVNIDKQLLESIIRLNVYDDIMYYKDSTFIRNTLFDTLLEENEGLSFSSNDRLSEIISMYRASCSDELLNIVLDNGISLRFYDKFILDGIVYDLSGRSLFDGNDRLNGARIALTILSSSSL